MDEKTLLGLIAEGKSERLEFKTVDALYNAESVASEVVAFANRSGGKILFGVTDDKSLENAKLDWEVETERISNIIRDRCSPQPEFMVDRYTDKHGDVLVLDISARRGIPVAVVDRSNHEIGPRSYFVRTVWGKRRVDDTALSWMFAHVGEPKIDYHFMTDLVYLEPQMLVSAHNILQSATYYRPILNTLKTEDKEFLLEDNPNRMVTFVMEMAPLALLQDLAWSFQDSWLPTIVRTKRTKVIRPPQEVMKEEKISLGDIEIPQGSSGPELSPRIRDAVLDARAPGAKITLPPQTRIRIAYEDETGRTTKAALEIVHEKAFKLRVSFQCHRWCQGLPSDHPYKRTYDRFADSLFVSGRYEGLAATVRLLGDFSAKFSYPDTEDPLFSKHYDYVTTVLDSIKESWDWDYALDRLPDSLLYSMDDKIDQILENMMHILGRSHSSELGKEPRKI